MVGLIKGVGSGNWGGRSGDSRKSYDTTFDFLLSRLLNNRDPRPKDYEPTLRGIQKALGLEGETFHRFRIGTTIPEAVILAHMEALLYFEYEKLPAQQYWDYIARFSIRIVYRKMEDTEKVEEVLEIHLGNILFHTRKFPIKQNRKFRETVFQHIGVITPPVRKDVWQKIIERSLTGGFRGRKVAE